MDEGDARNLVALLRRELRPIPGRLGDSVRIVVVVLATVAIAETFRIPESAVSAYIVLFLSGRQAVTTVRRRWSRASLSCWRFSRQSQLSCSACRSQRSAFR